MSNFPLHSKVLKCDIEGVKELIAKGVSLDELDSSGQSALHWAVFGGYDDIVKILLEAGANANIISGDGVSPKWRAQDFDLVEIEKLLTLYGGEVLTNENFDRKAFAVFNKAIGRDLPNDEK